MSDAAVCCRCRQACGEQVRETHVGRRVRTIVGDRDVESNCIAFGRSTGTAGQSLHGDQVGLFININGLNKVITDGAWVWLVASCCGDDVGDHHARRAGVNSGGNRDDGSFAAIECADGPETGHRIIRTTYAGVAHVRQASWQRIGQRDVGRLSGTVVGDFDLESHRVANRWRTVAACECLDCDEVCRVVDNDGFVEVIAKCGWVGLVARGGAGDVGDRVSALAHIDRSADRNGGRVTRAKRANRPCSRGCVIDSLRYRAARESNATGQLIRQDDAGRLSRSVVGNVNLEGYGVAFGGRAIAAGECFHGHQICVGLDVNGFG